MTRPAVDFSRAAIDEARAERARRALISFRRMCPQMSGLAQAITGRDDVRVQPGMGNYTDGDTIFMRPPIELGDELRHDLRLCNAGRTPHGPVCPACLSRENVIMGLYHEIAHIAFDSFAPVSDTTKLEAIDHAIREREADDKRAALIRARIESAPPMLTNSYKGLSSLVSPHLPNLVNAIEDFRVNRELTAARPGTREAFTARYRRVFAEGIETDNGDVMLWENQPANAQAIIGVFAALNGLAYDDWFSPEVVAMLHSDDVQAVLRDAGRVRSAAAVYSVAFPVLEAMRKHGFCKRADDPEPEPEPEPEEQPETDEPRPEQGKPSDEDSKPNPEREDKPEKGEPSDDDSDDDGGEGADGDDDEDGSDDGEPGAEDGDTDEPADDDAEGDSDGDASEDDEGDGEGAGDSEGADGEPSDQGSGITGTGDIEADHAEGSDDADPENGEHGEHDGAEPDDVDGEPDGSGDDVDASSTPERDGAEPDGEPGAEPGEPTSDSDERADRPEAGTDPGESKLEEVDVEAEPTPEPFTADGEPEEAQDALDKFLGHAEHDPSPEQAAEQKADELEVDRAIAGEAFDSGSKTVFGIRHHHFDKPYISVDGTNESFGGYYGAWGARRAYGTSSVDSLRAPESVLGPALMQMRAVFADNAKWKRETGLRSGKVNARTLGRRVTVGDDRLFHKRDRPGKRDYHVLIGLDISGSTRGGAITTIKAAAFAQADLLRRAGISFEMYAHTGAMHDLNPSMLSLDIYHIKDTNEAWDNKTQERLALIGGSAANLDGHTLEFYRKQMDKSTATDRIIMYYTDGAMPAENYHEELAILQREIGVCKRKGYTLMAVGVGNDDPVQYGLDTVRIDRVDEVRAVVKHLEKRLVR